MTASQLTPDAGRERAWTALAELFVGRELQDYDFDDIGRELVATGLTPAQLHDVLWHEVAPVFGQNLAWFNPTPEMEGWSGDRVGEWVRQRLQRGATLAQRLEVWLLPDSMRRLVEQRWQEVERRLLSA
ncbi:MAG: hypothetical protein L6Q73_04140 [Aquabacterium sp.]|nr:hypothetical protein [Aquabacterium sp.]